MHQLYDTSGQLEDPSSLETQFSDHSILDAPTMELGEHILQIITVGVHSPEFIEVLMRLLDITMRQRVPAELCLSCTALRSLKRPVAAVQQSMH